MKGASWVAVALVLGVVPAAAAPEGQWCARLDLDNVPPKVEIKPENCLVNGGPEYDPTKAPHWVSGSLIGLCAVVAPEGHAVVQTWVCLDEAGIAPPYPTAWTLEGTTLLWAYAP